MLHRRDSNNTTEFLLGWKVALTVLHSIAIASTVFRVWYRHHIHRLWWDDYLAIVPTILEIVYAVFALWLRDRGSMGPTGDELIKKRMMIYYWVSSIPFLCIIWTTRMCLALSIARIFVPRTTPRRFALTLVVIFSFACIGSTVAKIVTSLLDDRSGAPHFFERANCGGGKKLCIAGFTLDIMADLVLMVSPLYMLWHVRLPRNQRYLVFAVFSASFWTLLVAIVYFLCAFSPIKETHAGPALLVTVPHIESVVAVFVSNLSVIISFLYRNFRYYGDMDTVATSEEPSRTVPIMTITSPRVLNSSVLISTTIISTNSTAMTSVYPSSDDLELSSRNSKISESTISTSTRVT